jgi:hypothetical protein
LFWTDHWLPGGCSVADAFLQLASFVRKSNISVAQGLLANRWVRGIRGGVSTVAMGQYLQLWDMIASIQLQHGVHDKMIWTHIVDG